MISDFRYSTPIPTRFNDFDLFGHVNNAVYLTYFEIARSKFWEDIVKWEWEVMGIILAKAEIEFLKPVRMNDSIKAYVRTASVRTTSFVLEYVLTRDNDGEEEICTKGSTVCVTFDYQKNEKAPIPAPQLSRMLEFDALV